MGGAPGFPEQGSRSKVLLMHFIPGCLGALQTTLNKDEACWKTACQVGQGSQHTGVDHCPVPHPLTVQLCLLI